MKKVLSIIMVLAMLIASVSVTVFAEDLGSYENPYQVQAGSLTPTAVTIPAESEAYVAVDDDNNSTLTIGHSTSAEYQVYYCRQPITPEADGTMEFTMVDGADYFCIINPTTSDIVVRILLTAGAGGANYGTVDNPEPLALEESMFGYGATAFTALEAGNQGYYYTVTAPAAGIISVSAGAMDDDYNFIGWMWSVSNITAGKYGDIHWSDEEEPVYYEDIAVSEGDELQIFASTYDPASMWSSPAGNVTVDLSFSPLGSWGCPEEIVPGSYSATLAAGNFSGYNYVWTATESGTATVTMDSASNWSYNISGVTPEEEYFYFGDYHWFDDDPVVPSESVTVNAGDKLSIAVNTYDANTGMACDGTVEWTLTFVPGEGSGGDIGGGDIGGGDIGGGDIGGGDEPLEQNWELSDTALSVGTDSYAASNTYPYTVYAFEPTETGKYTFTATDALIGLASNNGMWITAGTSTDAITEGVTTGNTFEWICTSVGQSIWVVALPNTNVATITVAYEEVVIKEIPREYYENTVTPEAFVFGGDADSLDYVDTFDGVEDKAVLGSDGFYHLNSADGPILFANLNDPMMSLSAANGFGQLKQLIKEDGEVVLMIDYTVAMIDYLACMDEETGLYPLTADLIEVFSKAGTSLGWYGEEGWLGGVDGDEWMFACYYSEDIKGESDIPTGGNDGANDGANGNTGTQGGANAPSTGDNVVFVVIIGFTALVAAAAIIVIRRRRTN
ncbi:MAG: LPXTG cell wall anchor domain-containing protein [Ruminococcaceae bacterium]|nr:LPXTG cell wall anchor domain-containing protein [Oscillospiraceae bacterium]